MGNERRCDTCVEDRFSNKMSEKTIFQKIIDRELSSEILYEDDDIICIKDKFPVMPIHLLLITKKVIPSLQKIEEKDYFLLSKITKKAQDLAKQFNIEDNYRLVTNVGEKSGQSIHHLHFHLLSAAKSETTLTKEG